MSVRRWIGITGIVVAVAGGAVGTGRVGSGSQFEARAFLLEGRQERNPAQLLDDRERFLESPEVRDLVRSRLGETPPVWARAATDDTILVRSRGETPEQASKATEAYAASYIDVRRRHIESGVSAAAENIQRKTDQLRAQLESAEEPQRTSLVGLLGLFNTQLDRLQGDHFAPAWSVPLPLNRFTTGPGARCPWLGWAQLWPPAPSYRLPEELASVPRR